MKSCKTKKCGCIDTGLTTPTPCAHDTIECPVPDPCAETFSDCCVVHNGDGIAELNIQTGDRICDIWQKIALAISAAGGDGVTIESVTVEGNDLIITMTDGTIFTTPLPATTVPNDDWVIIQNNGEGISAVTWQGSATNNAGPIINVAYKILSEDTVLVKVLAFLDINITAPDNSLNFRFTLDNIAIGASNWFPGVTKYFNSTLGPVLTPTPFAVPVQLTAVSDGVTPGVLLPTLDEYQSKGRAFINNGLVFAQSVSPVLSTNGHYQFQVEFELSAQLLPV